MALVAVIAAVAVIAVCQFPQGNEPEPERERASRDRTPAEDISPQSGTAAPGTAVSVSLSPDEAGQLEHPSGAKIVIPLGATAEQVTVSIGEVAPPDSTIEVRKAFEFSVGDADLIQPVTIHIPFALEPGEDASRVRALRWDEEQGEWELVNGTVNLATRTVAVSTPELSIWTTVVNTWQDLTGQGDVGSVDHTCRTKPRTPATSNPYNKDTFLEIAVESSVTNHTVEQEIYVRFEVINSHLGLHTTAETDSATVPKGQDETFVLITNLDFPDADYTARCTVVAKDTSFWFDKDLAVQTIPMVVKGPATIAAPKGKQTGLLESCRPGSETIGVGARVRFEATVNQLDEHRDKKFRTDFHIYKSGEQIWHESKEWEPDVRPINILAQAINRDDGGIKIRPGNTNALNEPGKYVYKCFLRSNTFILDSPQAEFLKRVPVCTKSNVVASVCVAVTAYESVPNWHFQALRTGSFCVGDCSPPFVTHHEVAGDGSEVGKPITLAFRINDLVDDAEHGGITVSFPDLTLPNQIFGTSSYTSAQGSVTTSGLPTRNSRVTYYANGDQLWRYRGDNVEAEHLMVESYDAGWPSGADRTLELTFTPSADGEFEIRYRYWLCSNDGELCSRDPVEADVFDQQEWESHVITIAVNLPKQEPTPQTQTGATGVEQATAEPDRPALVALYESTNGSRWKNNVQGNQPWLVDDTNSSIKDWRGVATDGSRVTTLILEENCLRGTLPPEIGDLVHLRDLILHRNSRLGCGDLEGPIPPSLGGLTELMILDLSENNLNRVIPAALGDGLLQLDILNLSRNRLSGGIPTSLGKLTNLTELDLSNNRLKGEIPAELGNLTNLGVLRLSGGGNQFDGCIPSGLEDVPDNDLSALKLETCASEGGTGGFTVPSYSSGGTPSTGTTQQPSVTQSPPAGPAFARNPSQDFKALAASNTSPWGLWSDGETMWVSDEFGGRIYAYDLDTKERITEKEFDSTLAPGNNQLMGIWSNGETMWVSDLGSSRIYAYDLDTKQRESSKEFNSLPSNGTVRPLGIASDGTTLWTSGFGRGDLNAFSLASKTSASTKDIAPALDFYTYTMEGLWYERATGRVWVVAGRAKKVFTFDTVTGSRAPVEFDISEEGGSTNTIGPRGIWSDGETVWIADQENYRILAYNMPPGSAEGAPHVSTATPLESTIPQSDVVPYISSGINHTCVLNIHGGVTCWGEKTDGRTASPKGQDFISISSGGLHTCALSKDGSPVCWGTNDSGETTFPLNERFSAISGGGSHTCGLRENGTAVCWGGTSDPYGSFGGRGTEPEGEKFISLAGGRHHTCGLRANGSVMCWGDTAYGAATPPNINDISSLNEHSYWNTCALRPNGKAICWGYNNRGQSSPPEDLVFTSISSGAVHTCGLQTSGAVSCWGSNRRYDGSVLYGQSTPPDGTTFVAISAGYNHNCGIVIDGSVVCWGDDSHGQSSPPPGLKLW